MRHHSFINDDVARMPNQSLLDIGLLQYSHLSMYNIAIIGVQSGGGGERRFFATPLFWFKDFTKRLNFYQYSLLPQSRPPPFELLYTPLFTSLGWCHPFVIGCISELTCKTFLKPAQRRWEKKVWHSKNSLEKFIVTKQETLINIIQSSGCTYKRFLLSLENVIYLLSVRQSVCHS